MSSQSSPHSARSNMTATLCPSVSVTNRTPLIAIPPSGSSVDLSVDIITPQSSLSVVSCPSWIVHHSLSFFTTGNGQLTADSAYQHQVFEAEALSAISPLSFIISSVISAEAYMSFTSSHSLT